ncbi:hypothetical protein GBA52_010817 [Prunus armeniaca]|nr:hypothetical protein GBA52_010817 [Prunus armeniaca]
MSHIVWNCQGLGSNLTVRVLHGLIWKHRPFVVFLMETKMRDDRISSVRMRMGFIDNFNVPPVGSARGLSLWWDESVKVTIWRSSQNMIDTKVEIIQIG